MHLESEFGYLMLKGEITDGSLVKVDYRDGELIFNSTSQEPPEFV
ncbi:MAG: hypothetical protein ACMUHB_00960 [Thermoplasmatota archaeon]